MLCRFCGMESATTDVCSWCGKPLAGTQTPPPAEQIPIAQAETPAQTPVAALLNGPSENESSANAVTPTNTPRLTPPINRRVAPAMPVGGRMRPPAPGMPVPSAPPPVAAPANQSAEAAPRPAPSLAGADLNALAAPILAPLNPRPTLPDEGAAGIGSIAPSPVLAAPLSSGAADVPAAPPQARANIIGATIIGANTGANAQANAQTNTAGAGALGANAAGVPAAGAQGVGTESAGTGRGAARVLNARPAVDMTGEVAIGTVAAPQRGLDDAPALEPKMTMDATQRKAAVDAALADDGPTPVALLTRYAGIMAGILLATGVLAFVAHRFYIAPMLIAMFAGGFLLPVLHVTPFADEDADDLVWFVLLTLLFGPLVGLIIFGVVAVMRQEFNPSILGCFVVAALARVIAELASGGIAAGHLLQATSPFGSLGHMDARLVEMLLLNWAGFATLAGWYAASSFHKEDE